ncbi:N-6 DNA methylase [Streptomyces sp. 7N604]|uniref:N-6 DNA methylase n=1 Tax=Streptomyces sp. 7N604 TaxID=3457415 RepID=UPI003FD22FEF
MLSAPHEGRLLTQAQIGSLAGVARTTVNYWRKMPGFPAAERAGDMELFRQDAILAWLDDRAIPGRSRGASEPDGATYGDRMRRALRTAADATGGTPEFPLTRPTPRLSPAERSSRDVQRVRELMGEQVERVRGAGSVVDYMNLLLCLLFLRGADDPHWGRVMEQAGTGSGSDGSRLLLRHIGEVVDELLKRLGMVPGMQEQLLRLEPRTYADLTSVVRQVGLLGPGAFRLVLDEYERRAGLRSGEFFTPHAVARIMVSIALDERAPGTLGAVFDPYARGGELLAAAVEHRQASFPREVRGYSHAHGTARLASMNLALLGVRSWVRLSRRTPWSQGRERVASQFSLVLTNPPFNMSDSTREARAEGDWPYGAPPVGNDNLAYPQYVVGCLENGGAAAVVMPNKAGDSANSAEQAIRENLVEQGVVRCVLELPDRLFSSTSVPVSVWFLGSPANACKDVVFLDAREVGTTHKGRRVLGDEDVQAVVEAYRMARSSRVGEQPLADGGVRNGLVPTAVVSREAIRETGYSLRPTVHLGTGRHQPPVTDRAVTQAWHTVEQLRWEVQEADADVAAAGIGTGFPPSAKERDATLIELCDIAAGPSYTRLRAEPPAPDGDVPMVYPSHLRNGRIDHIGDRYVSFRLADRLRDFRVEAGDILCIRSGAMGPPALVRPQEAGWLISTNLLRLRVKERAEVDPAYLAAYLGRPDAVAWVRDRASATGAPTISKASLGTQPVVLPPYDEQRRIAGALAALEAQAAAHLRFATAVTEARATMADLLTAFDQLR